MGFAGELSGGKWEAAGVRRERMVHGAESMGGEAAEDRSQRSEGTPVKYASPLLNSLRCHCHEFNLASCH